MTEGKLTETVTVRMSQELKNRIEELARENRRKASEMIRLILEQSLDSLHETPPAPQGG